MTTQNAKAKRHPELNRAPFELIAGRIHGTGKHLSDAERDEARGLRKHAPKVYMCRGFAPIYGTDAASMCYLPAGGRAAALKKAGHRSAQKSARS